MGTQVEVLPFEELEKLAIAMAKNPCTSILDKSEALKILNRENVKTKEDYESVCNLYPSGEPAIGPSTYTPKPPGDNTPQWIWDHYQNGGRTS